MNKLNISLTPHEVMRLVEQTYVFISTQMKMTDDDIKLVASTLCEIIEKNNALKG